MKLGMAKWYRLGTFFDRIIQNFGKSTSKIVAISFKKSAASVADHKIWPKCWHFFPLKRSWT
jgi:hypothetical protein